MGPAQHRIARTRAAVAALILCQTRRSSRRSYRSYAARYLRLSSGYTEVKNRKINMSTAIFELPVYRCGEQQFESRYTADLQFHLASLEKRSGGVTREQAPTTYCSAQSAFLDSYGGPWRYNQVIAWLQLCVGRSSICADLWLWNAKQFRRAPRKKKFWFIGTESIVKCEPRSASPQIFTALSRRFDTYETAWRRRGFVLDRECIMQLGPFVNWRQLLNHASAVRSPKWLEGFNGTPLSIDARTSCDPV